MTKVNKTTAKTTAEELFQELPAVKVATHIYAESEVKNLITIEWLLGYKSAFEEALKKFKKDLDEGVVGGDAPEPVTKDTVKRYARDFMTALKNDHCIEFNTNGRKLNQAEKDKLEAKAIKSRAVTATKKTASSVASNITSMIGDIRDLANELVNRKGDKVRSPSAKKALTQLNQIEKTVSKKLEALLK